jgi:thioredoxin reductase (NADPH)
MVETAEYDVVIIGAGPAGLTASLYTTRGGLKAVVLEKMAPGGQAATTDVVENYPGFPDGVTGPELMALMEEQAKKFGAEIVSITEVNGIKKEGDLFTVQAGEKKIMAKTVIIASGAQPRELGIPGEGKFRGRGVSYCAVCDGAFYKNADIAVVGGGNAAVEEALYLTRYAKKVFLIHRRDRLRAESVLADRAVSHPQIEIVWDTIVEEVVGDAGVARLKIKNVKTEESGELPVEGIFIYVGFIPSVDFLDGIVSTDKNGFIITGDTMETSLPGLFACGDVRSKGLRQIVTAAGEGATAAFFAEKYIDALEGKEYGEFHPS